MTRLLRLGRLAVLRALLDARLAIQKNGEYGYLLNRLYLDDYCVWMQQGCKPSSLAKLIGAVDAVALSKDMISWPLEAYEQLAMESTEEEGGGGISYAADAAAAAMQEEEEEEDDDDDEEDSSSSSAMSDDSSDEEDGRRKVTRMRAEAPPGTSMDVPAVAEEGVLV